MLPLATGPVIDGAHGAASQVSPEVFRLAGATVHGLMAGTDTGRGWADAIYLGAAGSVAAATAWRVLTATTTKTRGALT